MLSRVRKSVAILRLSTLISLVSLAVFSTVSSCKPPVDETDEKEAFVEDGEPWAWGIVQLTGIDTPASLRVEKLGSSDQSVDTRKEGYRLYGAIEARTGGRGLRDLTYVDRHPSQGKLLAYTYKLEWRDDLTVEGRVQLYAVLRKAGPSREGQHKVLLGQADFAGDGEVATLQIADGLQLSLIAYGVYAGQWALHYTPVKHVVVSPWQGRCPKVSQMPGQKPNQNPSQFKTCKPIPSQVDLCGGDPTKKGCRPQLPQLPGQTKPDPDAPAQQPLPRTQGLRTVTGETRIFTMEPGEKQAKLVFISEAVEADVDKNLDLCGRGFFAVARTVGGQINDACVLKAAPSEPVDGRLACAVTVSFDDPQTYMDKVCNVIATFQPQEGVPSRSQVVQILKK